MVSEGSAKLGSPRIKGCSHQRLAIHGIVQEVYNVHQVFWKKRRLGIKIHVFMLNPSPINCYFEIIKPKLLEQYRWSLYSTKHLSPSLYFFIKVNDPSFNKQLNCGLTIILETIIWIDIEHKSTFFYAKASPVLKYSMDNGRLEPY